MSNQTSPSITRNTSSSRVWMCRGGLNPSGIVAWKTDSPPPVTSLGTRNSQRLSPYQRASPWWERNGSLELVHSQLALRDPSHAALHVPWLRSLSGRLDGLALERA